MPGGDRTGPMGMGPRTGRAAGYCSGAGLPGYADALPARGLGMGFGWGGRGRRFCGGGRGFRNRFFAAGVPGWIGFGYVPSHPDSEKQSLNNEAEALRAGLEEIDKRLGELEAAKKREGKV